jgi:tetratricopeptide (TPR) repeat protein
MRWRRSIQKKAWRDPETWPRARRLDALLLVLVGGDTVPAGADEPASYLLDGLAAYRHYCLASYEDARPLYENALAIREKVLGPEHPDTVESLNNLACMLRDHGDLAGSRTLHERALVIAEKVLGPEHPKMAGNLNILAGLLRDLGQMDEAEPLFRRAIAVGEKSRGAEHSLTRRYQSHYASLLLMTDRVADALQLGEAALATHDKVLSPDHPSTKDSARVTATALAALGRGEEATAMRRKYQIEDRAG